MKIFSKMILGLSLSLGSSFVQAQEVNSIWLQIAHCSGKIENEEVEVDLSFQPTTSSILMSCWYGTDPKFTFTTKTLEDSLHGLTFEPEWDVKYAFQYESFKYSLDKLYVKTTTNEFLLKCKLLGPF